MKKTELLSEGLLIAFISTLSYAVAYAYRSGIAKHFGLPPLMLSPSVGDILKACGTIGVTALIIWNVAHIVWPLAPDSGTALARSIRNLILISFICATFMFTAFEAKAAGISLLVIVIVFAILEFIFPLVSQNKIKGYENKLKEQEKIEAEFHKSTPSEYVSKVIGETGLSLAGLAVGMLLLGYFAGLREARTQEEFFVAAERPGYVIAILNDSMALFVKYDPNTHTLGNEYLIEPMGQSLQLRKERIGRLVAPPEAINKEKPHNSLQVRQP